MLSASRFEIMSKRDFFQHVFFLSFSTGHSKMPSLHRPGGVICTPHFTMYTFHFTMCTPLVMYLSVLRNNLHIDLYQIIVVSITLAGGCM